MASDKDDERLETMADIIELSQRLESTLLDHLDLIKKGITTHRELLVQISNLVDGS